MSHCLSSLNLYKLTKNCTWIFLSFQVSMWISLISSFNPTHPPCFGCFSFFFLGVPGPAEALVAPKVSSDDFSRLQRSSNWIISPRIRVKIQNIWNHYLVYTATLLAHCGEHLKNKTPSCCMPLNFGVGLFAGNNSNGPGSWELDVFGL